MKKYITLATLLAAGAALSNAETVDFDLIRDNTNVSFSETSDLVELTYIDWTYVGGGNSNAGAFVTTSQSNYANTFSPSGQLRGNQAGDSWTMTFSVKNTASEAITLESFTFDGYVINGDGSNKAQIGDGMKLDVALTDCTAVSEALFKTGNEVGTVELSFVSPVILEAGASKELCFTLSNARSFNTYAGLTGGSVSFNIPEPSAFGLLAGLGALALVGTRRRRR